MYVFKQKYYREYFPGIAPLSYIFSIIVVMLLLFASVNTVALHRMIYYAMPFAILVSVYIGLTHLKIKKNIKYIMLPFLMYSLYTIFWFSFSSHADRCYIPYQNFLLI